MPKHSHDPSPQYVAQPGPQYQHQAPVQQPYYPPPHNRNQPQYSGNPSYNPNMGAASAIIVVFVTILFPPAGAFLVAGCGVDLLINILLTCLGYIPGHIHAFYLEYIYYRNQEAAHMGRAPERAPGIFSNKVQNGGSRLGGMSTYGPDGGNYGAMPAQGGGYQQPAGYGGVDQGAAARY